MRQTFDGIPIESIGRMLSGNAAEAYGFDLAKLRPVADRIGPTIDDVVSAPPLEPSPALRYSLAFRTSGAWS
jgi:hypothetical protein